jgi:chromate transporter
MMIDERVSVLKQQYTLRELVMYFLKLGYMGFGGPVALVGYMHRDLVEEKKWISEDEYKEGMALAQLSPGPLAAQLGIYLGYVDYGIIGATLAGIAFVLPSFVMVLVIGIAYKIYGGLPWMQAVFYGVGSCVIGIICLSAYKLTTKSISKLNGEAMKKQWMLWFFYFFAAIFTVISQSEPVSLFIAAGILYMLVKAPPAFLKKNVTSLIFFLTVPAVIWIDHSERLWDIAWFFTKAGAFVFGSGLAIVPFLHGGVVNEFHWLNEKEFLDAVAVAMITPGPVVITVGFIGYLASGVAGACVASLATFLPCYLLTVIPAPYFKKIAKNTSIKAFVDGITAAVVGALAGAVVVIAINTFTRNRTVAIDIPSILIAVATVVCLLKVKKLTEPILILISAVIGLMLKLVIM